MFGRTRKTAQSSLSAAQQLQQWDGSYKWEGEIDNTNQPRFANGLEAPPDLLQVLAGLSDARVSRKAALSVGAVLRARNVIAGISSTLKMFAYNSDTYEVSQQAPLVRDPHSDPSITASFMYAMTVEDLFFEGISYWKVTSRRGRFPSSARRIDPKAISQHAIMGMPSEIISEDFQFGVRDPIFIDGIPQNPEDIIRFISPNPPFLVHAARAVRTCILLDQVAKQYSDNPIPLGYFTDADEDADALDDAEIKAILDQWAVARRERVWGYVPKSLKVEQLQWNARQIQLEEARTTAVLEIARAAGLDMEDVAVSIQGASRTYVNAEQRRLDLIDFTLMPYLNTVEERLSADDISPEGIDAGFDSSGFLRADLKTRMESYGIAIPNGVMTVDEARAAEKRPGLSRSAGDTPSQNGNGDNVRPIRTNGNGVMANGN